MNREDVTGLVLAGGLGRRMSEDGCGVDKGLQPFGDRPLVAHVVEAGESFRKRSQDRISLIYRDQTEVFHPQFGVYREGIVPILGYSDSHSVGDLLVPTTHHTSDHQC